MTTRPPIELRQIIDLIGKYDEHGVCVKLLEELGCENPSTGNFTSNPELSLMAYFSPARDFEWKYDGPEFVMPPDPETRILTELRLNDLIKMQEEAPWIALPFGLAYGMHEADLQKQVGVKAYLRSKQYLRNGKVGLFLWIDCDAYKISASFDEEHLLYQISFMSFDQRERAELAFKAAMKDQKKNIKAELEANVRAFKTQFPTANWQDSPYKDGLKQLEQQFDEFVDVVAQNTRSRNPSSINEAVKKLVLAINRVNAQSYGFIETMEREIICQFIRETVTASGFQIPDTVDITAEWREW